VALIVALGISAGPAFPEVAPLAAEVVADRIVVSVVPDTDGVEKGLTGTHVVRTQPAERSSENLVEMTVGCVPCFSVYMSFALSGGRLYAMNWQTDKRRARYHAEVNGHAIEVEAMNALRGRDWVDAFAGVGRVPGCARDPAKEQQRETALKRGICPLP
jgi:hypothetical protein